MRTFLSHFGDLNPFSAAPLYAVRVVVGLEEQSEARRKQNKTYLGSGSREDKKTIGCSRGLNHGNCLFLLLG